MLYPIFIKLNGKRCLVVGGGKVAERKIRSLLKAGASVTVNSPGVTPGIRELADRKELSLVSSEFREDCLRQCFMVIGATDDEDTNKRIALEAERLNILYNIVDVPDICNFYVPSLVKRGDLSIAISSNGKSPALSKRLRKKLEKEFGEEYAGLLRLMGALRERVVQSDLDLAERGRLFETLLDSGLLELFRENRGAEATRKANEMVDEWIRNAEAKMENQ